MKSEEYAIIQRYFPEAAVEAVAKTYDTFPFKLKFTAPRSSKLGDFRSPRQKGGLCTITLNADLHPYQMLITFVHELAHLVTFRQYGPKVQSHGKEWKNTYEQLMRPYLIDAIFPDDILQALRIHFLNVKASSCCDLDLSRLLKSYQDNGNRKPTVEDLPENTIFLAPNGLLLQKGIRLRKRYRCQCVGSKRCYLVNPLMEVEVMDDPQ